MTLMKRKGIANWKRENWMAVSGEMALGGAVGVWWGGVNEWMGWKGGWMSEWKME